MLASEKLFKKSIRENLYVSIREIFQRRVSENFFKKSIRESIHVSIKEIFEEEYQRKHLC